ncbi:copper resistance protein NlpE N-terminal domain-containing protein [Breznakiellaceae bacterium SP9]
MWGVDSSKDAAAPIPTGGVQVDATITQVKGALATEEEVVLTPQQEREIGQLLDDLSDWYQRTIKSKQEAAAEPKGPSFEVFVLHTNDHHGAVLPDTDKRGGLAERAAFVKGIRDKVNSKDRVFLIDAGGINTGSVVSDLSDAAPDFLAYKYIGYDYATFGETEFNVSLKTLLNQIDIGGVQFISSNIKTADGKYLGGHQYAVEEYEGIKVGIFGITSLHLLKSVNYDTSLTLINEVDAAREVVDILVNKEKVDVVLGLVHLGDTKESVDQITASELALAVPRIDALVDGHSSKDYEINLLNDTFIVRAGEKGKYVGLAKFVIDNGVLVDATWDPVEINSATYTADPIVQTLIKPYADKANAAEPAFEDLLKELQSWYLRNQKYPAEAIDAAHNSRNSVNWAGVYGGVIPAADGPGITVEITLNNDGTYSISYQYIDRGDEVFTGSGTFKWNDAGSTIALDFEDKDAPSPFAPYYQVGENILIQLDMTGEKITGALADNYVLKKVLE